MILTPSFSVPLGVAVRPSPPPSGRAPSGRALSDPHAVMSTALAKTADTTQGVVIRIRIRPPHQAPDHVGKRPEDV
ncbi:hypothetical protein GCM10010214_40500 [Streptomyces abikoensis]|nr:hypothetical protein GCM10010214_40500 [Streptomyces abikoensis]